MLWLRRNLQWIMIIGMSFAAGVFAILTMMQVSAQENSFRTQYDSFDLSKPEAAVMTFVDAFQQRDYAGLFLIFAPQAQIAWQRSISAFNFSNIVDPKSADQLFDNLTYGFNHTQEEHGANLTDYIFDSIMLFAEEQDAFLVDLRGDVQILRTEDNTIPAYDDPEADSEDETPLPVVDVIASVEGIEGEVTFRMVPTPSNRWQVMQVIVPGGDEKMLPWSIAPNP